MSSLLHKLIPWSWALLWFMLPVSMKGTVIMLWIFGIMAVAGAIVQGPVTGKEKRVTTLLFILFFLWQVAATLLAPGHVAIRPLEKFLPLAVIPLLLSFADQQRHRFETWAVRGLFGGLALSGLHMIVNALVTTLRGGGAEAWTYHAFAGPYHAGAIYYSWYLSSAIFYLVFREPEPMVRRYRPVFLALFLLLLLLCSSKLMVIFTVPVALWGVITRWTGIKNKKLLAGLIAVLVVLGSIPFMNRIAELRGTHPGMAFKEEYSAESRFNGVTLRLLQWRLAFRIVDEQDAWLAGTGMVQKQRLLDEQYKELGVYTGDPETGNTGYLGYNFHDQYVETLVGTGMAGLLLLLTLLAWLLTVRGKKLVFPLVFFILTALFFVTESVLERQAGIVFFSLAACTVRSRAVNNQQLIDGSRTEERNISPGTEGSAGHPSFQPHKGDTA